MQKRSDGFTTVSLHVIMKLQFLFYDFWRAPKFGHDLPQSNLTVERVPKGDEESWCEDAFIQLVMQKRSDGFTTVSLHVIMKLQFLFYDFWRAPKFGHDLPQSNLTVERVPKGDEERENWPPNCTHWFLGLGAM